MSVHLHAAFSERPWALRGAHLLLPDGRRGVARRVQCPDVGEEKILYVTDFRLESGDSIFLELDPDPGGSWAKLDDSHWFHCLSVEILSMDRDLLDGLLEEASLEVSQAEERRGRLESFRIDFLREMAIREGKEKIL